MDENTGRPVESEGLSVNRENLAGRVPAPEELDVNLTNLAKSVPTPEELDVNLTNLVKSVPAPEELSVNQSNLAGSEPPYYGTILEFVFGVVAPLLILLPVVWRICSLGTFFSELAPLDFDFFAFDLFGSAGIILFSILAAMTLAAIIYSVFLFAKKTPVPNPAWIVVSASCCIWFTFTLMCMLEYYDLFSIDPLLPLCALCMIIILVSMTRILRWLTPEGKEHSVGKPLLFLLLIPVVWYVVVNAGEYIFSSALASVPLLFLVATVYGFIFVLLRTFFLALRCSGKLPMQIIVLFVLPLLGLLVTQTGDIFSFFWDFSSPVYYVLVIVNGVLLMLPEPSRVSLRAWLLFLRGAMFLFAAYFFICLSPYYALSLPGIVFYGIGILVLAPLFLIVYQTKILLASVTDFSRSFGLVKTATIFVLGMLVLPLCLSLTFLHDKANVGAAISLMNGDTNANAGEINLSALRRSLNYMRGNEFGGWRETRNPPPMISALYSRVTSGGRVLSDASYARAQALFFAQESSLTGRNRSEDRVRSSPGVAISDIKVETRKEGDDYKSMVHFEIENTKDWNTQEYATSFALPDGVFISNYYLDVMGERKSGLLSVKQAALWIYNRVVSTSRDPGILYYSGDRIIFRVFPFSAGETRYTGIEFLHREPVELEIDGHEITLQADGGYLDSSARFDGAVYFGAEYKKQLQPLIRKPGYAFVIDCSKYSDIDALISRLENFCGRNGIDPVDIAITALNYRHITVPMSGDWKESVRRVSREGGFGVDIVADEIYESISDENVYPAMILLTDTIDDALLPSDTAYMSMLCPELEGYYVLDEDGLWLYPFDQYQSEEPVEDDAIFAVRPVLKSDEVEPIFLRDDGKPQVFLSGYAGPVQAIDRIYDATWESGMKLTGKIGQIRYSSGENRTADNLSVIKDSFTTGIMTPLTSYIVLETAEQEAQLKARQQQLLDSGNLDGEDNTPVRMSEPSMLFCVVAMLPVIWFIRRKRKA